MHLIIPYAAPPGPQCQAALPTLVLPRLTALLQTLQPSRQLSGTPEQCTPLYEQVRAHALGWTAPDGLVPWAALAAQQKGIGTEDAAQGWAWITPCHWQINADHVEMGEISRLALTQEECDTLRCAMQDYFAQDGITLHPFSTTQWLAQGAVFKQLPTASLDRVRGARVDNWMPRHAQARTLRKLQNEMQMLLYTHPVNDVRAAAKQEVINSFWVSGTGDLPHTPGADWANRFEAMVTVDDLRESALHDDARAWCAAWQALDAHVLTTHTPDQLTLCGENSAHTFSSPTGGWWSQLMRRTFQRPQVNAILNSL